MCAKQTARDEDRRRQRETAGTWPRYFCLLGLTTAVGSTCESVSAVTHLSSPQSSVLLRLSHCNQSVFFVHTSLRFCPSTALTYDFSLEAAIAQASPTVTASVTRRQRKRSMPAACRAPSTVIRRVPSVIMTHLIRCLWKILRFIRRHKTSWTNNLFQLLPVKESFGLLNGCLKYNKIVHGFWFSLSKIVT